MARRVWIIGAASGIGEATARLFSEKGWEVLGIDRNPASACAKKIQGDIGRRQTWDEAAATLKGPLDALVHCAAYQVEKKLSETSESEWDSMFATNVGSLRHAVQALDGRWGPDASLVAVSSVHAKATSLGLAGYAATKGALNALVRALALELSPNVRVNTIIPGAVTTPMLERGLQRAADPETMRRGLLEASPLKRIGEPRDVAHLALFLADPERAANLSGQEFVCDSGVLCRLPSE